MRAVLPSEPELGIQKRCCKCDDWWPLDEEFWYRNKCRGKGHWWFCCIACEQERQREGRARKAA